MTTKYERRRRRRRRRRMWVVKRGGIRWQGRKDGASGRRQPVVHTRGHCYRQRRTPSAHHSTLILTAFVPAFCGEHKRHCTFRQWSTHPQTPSSLRPTMTRLRSVCLCVLGYVRVRVRVRVDSIDLHSDVESVNAEPSHPINSRTFAQPCIIVSKCATNSHLLSLSASPVIALSSVRTLGLGLNFNKHEQIRAHGQTRSPLHRRRPLPDPMASFCRSFECPPAFPQFISFTAPRLP